MWAVGCTFAGWLFKTDTFFKGSSNEDQLVRIINILGSKKLYDCMARYKITLPSTLVPFVKDTEAVPFENLINMSNFGRIDENGLDLLRKILVYDKNERIMPKLAMQHPYFDPIRDLMEDDHPEKRV